MGPGVGKEDGGGFPGGEAALLPSPGSGAAALPEGGGLSRVEGPPLRAPVGPRLPDDGGRGVCNATRPSTCQRSIRFMSGREPRALMTLVSMVMVRGPPPPDLPPRSFGLDHHFEGAALAVAEGLHRLGERAQREAVGDELTQPERPALDQAQDLG